MLDALAEEAELFDMGLTELEATDDDGWLNPPPGVPEGHYWWWPGGLSTEYLDKNVNEWDSDGELHVDCAFHDT